MSTIVNIAQTKNSAQNKVGQKFKSNVGHAVNSAVLLGVKGCFSLCEELVGVGRSNELVCKRVYM